MKNTILNGLAQVLLIVFSVVLGLYLSERIEEAKDEKEADKLLLKIKAEVKDNAAILRDWAPYHRDLTKKLDSLIEDEAFLGRFVADENALFAEILSRGTFMGIMPNSDTWDIAKAHPLIVGFDHDDLLILSQVYNQQASTFALTKSVMDIFLLPDFNAPDKARGHLRNLWGQLREFVGRERQLLAFYARAEEILEIQPD